MSDKYTEIILNAFKEVNREHKADHGSALNMTHLRGAVHTALEEFDLIKDFINMERTPKR